MSADFGALFARPSWRCAGGRIPPAAVSADHAIVARRVNAAWRDVRARVSHLAPRELDLGAPGRALVGPFAEVTAWPTGRRCAPARLCGRGVRLVPYARVEIDVTQWSSGACELRVRPVSRRVTAWGGRRQRRYFALAHATADRLLRELTRDARPASTSGRTPAAPVVAVAARG